MIMLEDLNGVIGSGRVIEVNKGYAYNFLVPNRMAIPLGCKRSSEKAERGGAVKCSTEHLPAFLLFKRPTRNGTRLYSPIRASDIISLLKKFKAYFWKSQIALDRPIDKIGHYKIKIYSTRNMVVLTKLIVRET